MDDAAEQEAARIAALKRAWQEYEKVSVDRMRQGPPTTEGQLRSARWAAQVREHYLGRPLRDYSDQCGAGSQPAELHVCMGLGACKDFDVDKRADVAGTGNCATVRHVCHGDGGCRGQGACGYAGSEAEQFLPGAQACRFNGSCASPINESRVFSGGPMKGKSVWQQARRLFEARMYEAGLAFGPSPGEGIPDELVPKFDQ